jgi:hypothetical protein
MAYRLASATVIASIVILGPAYAEETQRELGAHVHGHGTLNIAIEDTVLTIELTAPGDDIVGFEHPPNGDDEMKAIADAKARLEDALNLFAPPAEASCTVTSANAVTRKEEHEEHEADTKAAASGEDHEEEGGEHSEFFAQYAFACQSPDALTKLTTRYFDQFERAKELEVTIIGPTGQSAQSIDRANPAIDLSATGQ